MSAQLQDDALAQSWQAGMTPILHKIFGDRASAAGIYKVFLSSNDRLSHISSQVTVLVGRGPVTGRPAGDVHGADKIHRRFGDITCAYLTYEHTPLPQADVCWYSSANFGVSATFLEDHATSATHAAALQSLLTTLRVGSLR